MVKRRDRESVIIREGRQKNDRPVPTLAQFWPEFLEGHVKANRQKPSTVSTRSSTSTSRRSRAGSPENAIAWSGRTST